jgi:hypothetical protein
LPVSQSGPLHPVVRPGSSRPSALLPSRGGRPCPRSSARAVLAAPRDAALVKQRGQGGAQKRPWRGTHCLNPCSEWPRSRQATSTEGVEAEGRRRHRWAFPGAQVCSSSTQAKGLRRRLPLPLLLLFLTARSWWATGKKGGLCCKKLKKMALLSSFDLP